MGPAPLFVYSLRYDKIVRLDAAMTRNSPLFESPARLIAIGCVLLLAAAAILAIVQRQALLAELEQESAALHRLASQRADQHDAHLTALSAIAVAAQGARSDLFLDVAATISRFYPRVDRRQARHDLAGGDDAPVARGTRGSVESRKSGQGLRILAGCGAA